MALFASTVSLVVPCDNLIKYNLPESLLNQTSISTNPSVKMVWSQSLCLEKDFGLFSPESLRFNNAVINRICSTGHSLGELPGYR